MLYIVGTPIGNLEDLSIRQAKIIADAEIILAEDTRTTGILLLKIKKLFGFDRNPDQRLNSYYKENEFEKLPEVLDFLRAGKEVALISQSGLPLISDPGSLLIKTLVIKQIPFVVIPGPTAVITALIYSGFDCQNFRFLGFLPKKENEIRKLFSHFKVFDHSTIVFYESPNRINRTLAVLNEIIPDADVAICRELTKKFEEITRGKPGDLTNKTYKGELTVVLNM